MPPVTNTLRPAKLARNIVAATVVLPSNFFARIEERSLRKINVQKMVVLF
jgi:hypothetical protein